MTGAWTNNWKGFKNRMLLGGAVSAAGLDTVYNTAGNLIPTIGGTWYVWSPLRSLYNSHGLSEGLTTVRFGTSDTAPAATDIDLGNDWSSGISYVSTNSGAATVNGATVSRTFTVTVQNTSAATVTVREFGLFTAVKATSGSSTASHGVMMYRAILDEPVDIAQYESATLTFTVSMTLGDPG